MNKELLLKLLVAEAEGKASKYERFRRRTKLSRKRRIEGLGGLTLGDFWS